MTEGYFDCAIFSSGIAIPYVVRVRYGFFLILACIHIVEVRTTTRMKQQVEEQKRYSLRNVERKDFRSEREVLADVRRESKNAAHEQNYSLLFPEQKKMSPSPSINIKQKSIKSGSTSKKRKIGKKAFCNKRPKVENKENIMDADEDITYQRNISKEYIVTDGDVPERENIEIVTDNKIQKENAAPQDHEKEGNTDTEESYDVDATVHALCHAVSCDKTEKECLVKNCTIAKQFLYHSSGCHGDKCTICKGMEIMVNKHAHICEMRLEECCPVPNCDKERLMVLEEWVRLKYEIYYMMDNAFRALLHAIDCKDKTCELVECRTIKYAVSHTKECKNNDDCNKKKFVMQLCKHHQQMCSDDSCEVPFCKEKFKQKKLMEYQNLFQQMYLRQLNTQLCAGNIPNRSMQSHNNVLIPPFVVDQNPESLPTNPWLTNFIPITNQNPSSQCVFPDADIVAVPLNFDPTSIANQLQIFNSYDPEQLQYLNQLGTEGSVGDGATPIRPIPGDDTRIDDLSVDATQIDMYQVHVSTPIASKDKKNDNLSYPTQPTGDEELFYKLWSGKSDDDCSKDALVSISPDEMKIRSQQGQCDILSPVLSPQTNEYTSESSEEVTKEDPSHSESCINKDEVVEKRNNYFQRESNLAIQNIEPYIEEEGDWSKIDFLKQQIMDEEEVETETADESECDLYQPDKHTGPVHDEKPCNHIIKSNVDHDQPLTAIEQTYLNNIMDEKKQRVAS